MNRAPLHPEPRATPANPGRSRRAFTLTELLAVITIIVILISVAIPAFVGMLRSTNQALAQSNFRIGIASARDAAVRSAGLNDSAAVFFYEPGGQTSIVTCIAVGELDGRTIWAIDPLTEAVTLPNGWMVSGFAPAGTIGTGDPGVASPATPPSWYESAQATPRYDPAFDNWVFPETGFFRTKNTAGRDTTRGDQGAYRQTFMVRFDGRTGGLSLENRSEGLVFAPDLSIGRGVQPWRQRSNPWASAEYRLDGEVDQAAYLRRLLSRPWNAGDPDREKLVGDLSTDSVLVKPTTLLALYNIRDLAQQIVREDAPPNFRGVDRTTGSLYVPPATPTAPDYSFTVASEANKAVAEVARLFTVDRYNGGVVEVTP